MRKGDLVESVAAKTSVSRSVAEAVINATLDTIIDTVASGDKVIITGFGTFEARARKSRTGRNPQTGNAIEIPASTAAAFSAGKTFSEAVKNKG
jgi:DNA-binding protein HU-beta